MKTCSFWKNFMKALLIIFIEILSFVLIYFQVNINQKGYNYISLAILLNIFIAIPYLSKKLISFEGLGFVLRFKQYANYIEDSLVELYKATLESKIHLRKMFFGEFRYEPEAYQSFRSLLSEINKLPNNIRERLKESITISAIKLAKNQIANLNYESKVVPPVAYLIEANDLPEPMNLKISDDFTKNFNEQSVLHAKEVYRILYNIAKNNISDN